MADRRQRERQRAGSNRRDTQHRVGGEWTTLTLPDGVEIFQPKGGTFRLDIVPYEVGEGNPYADKGEWYYERTYFVHNNIGPDNKKYVCPAKTAGLPCPVCDFRAKLARDPDGDEKLVDSLRAKERQLWLIYDHKDREKGVQLWDFSHWNFGRLLDKVRKDADEDEVYIDQFDDPDAGASLKVGFSEEKGGGYTFFETYSIDFKPRPNGLDTELLDHGICLDSILKVLPYDELKAILLQTAEEDEEEEEAEKKPRKKSKAKSKDDDEPEEDEPKTKSETKPKSKPEDKPRDDGLTTAEEVGIKVGTLVTSEEFGDCEVIRVSRDGTSLILEDENEEIHKAIGVDEVELMNTKKKPKPKVKEEDEDEDEPEPKPKKKSKGTEEEWDNW